MFDKTWATKRQQSRRVPVGTKPTLQERQRNNQRTSHCLRQWSPFPGRSKATAIYISFTRSSDPVGQDSRVLQPAARGFEIFRNCSRDFRSVFAVTSCSQDHEAALRPHHKTASLLLGNRQRLFWDRTAGCAFITSELEAMILKCFSELGHDQWRQPCRRRQRDDDQCSNSVESRPHLSVRATRRTRAQTTGASHAPCRKPISHCDWSVGFLCTRPNCWLHLLLSSPQLGEDGSQHWAPSSGSCITSKAIGRALPPPLSPAITLACSKGSVNAGSRLFVRKHNFTRCVRTGKPRSDTKRAEM